ncbi:MAG: glycosyltransferase family 4 protein [Vicinamibacterales bacterium]
MKRFGSIFPFTEHGHSDLRIGRLVANHDFVRALLRGADFDEFLFSGPSVGALREFREAVEGWGLPAARERAIRYVPLADLGAVLATEPFHVFHLGGWGYFMPGLHALRARYAAAPWPITGLIHSLNGRDLIDHAARLSSARLEPYDAILCTSRDGREAMRRLLAVGEAITGRRFAGRLSLLPLGVDDALSDANGDGARARRRLQIEPSTLVVLVLGRITPALKMDLAPLLRTWRTGVLPRLGPQSAVLVIAGGASDADLRLARDLVRSEGLEAHVRLQPNFLAAAKADLLAAADLSVALSDNTQETFGLSVIESMACGVPVVASRFSGYKDLVDHGEDGLLVDTYWCDGLPSDAYDDLLDPVAAQLQQAQSLAVDLDQTAEALVRLLSDEAGRKRMGARGREKVAGTYRWSRVIERYADEWDRLAAEAARSGPLDRGADTDPYRVSPTTRFGHYPSHRLTPETWLVRRDPDALAPAYTEVAPLLESTLLARLMDEATRPVSFGTLTARAGVPPDRAHFAVLWLLKYGVLRVVRTAG